MPRKKGKLTKGQPIGARSASGRLRDRTPCRVEPCLGVVRRKASLGVPANDTNTCDAIGRAYVAKLLGDDERATDMLNAARRFHGQYWYHYGDTAPKDSLYQFQSRDAGTQSDEQQRREREAIIEQIVTDTVKTIDGLGCMRNVRKAFDDLVVDKNPDSGPVWLDRLIVAKRGGKSASERDWHMLELAKQGLEAIA